MDKKYTIGNSVIHGKGVIAAASICNGEIIGRAVVSTDKGPMITEELGRYVNHSYKANSRLSKTGEDYDLLAIRDIAPGEEIVADYNFTPYYLEKPGDDFI